VHQTSCVGNTKKKLSEELIVYFPFDTPQSIQKMTQQFCVAAGEVLTEPLPSNDRRDAHIYTQTDERDL
jgi:hypothetical protein